MLLHDGVFTYDDLAKSTDLSNKTVRNMMDKVAAFYSEFHIQIEKKPGYGITLIGTEKDKFDCYHECLKQLKVPAPASSEIRQNIILFSLLVSDSPIRISTLEDMLFITRPSIYHDLGAIESYLAKFSIELSRSRRDGLRLITGEKRRRYCLTDWASLMQSEDLANYQVYPALIRFQQMIRNASERRFIQKFINDIAVSTNHSISSVSLNRAVTFLIVGISRVREEHFVNLNLQILNKISSISIYTAFRSNISLIEKRFAVSFREQEIIYFASVISSYMTSNYESLVKESKNTARILTAIDNCYRFLLTQVQPFNHEYFSQSLFPFFDSILQSMNYDFDIFNPNTSLIKESFPELFDICEQMKPIIFKDLGINLPESGAATITLLLADIRERYCSEIRCCMVVHEHSFERNLLTSTLRNIIPNLILITVDNLNSTDLSEIDLLLIDDPSYECSSVPCFVLPPLITGEFKDLIDPTISQIRHEKKSRFLIKRPN